MNTDCITVPARDLDIGDRINGARVTRRDPITTPGVVYVWVDDSDRTQARADMIFHHGDRVRITRVSDCSHRGDCDCAHGDPTGGCDCACHG